MGCFRIATSWERKELSHSHKRGSSYLLAVPFKISNNPLALPPEIVTAMATICLFQFINIYPRVDWKLKATSCQQTFSLSLHKWLAPPPQPAQIGQEANKPNRELSNTIHFLSSQGFTLSLTFADLSRRVQEYALYSFISIK